MTKNIIIVFRLVRIPVCKKERDELKKRTGKMEEIVIDHARNCNGFLEQAFKDYEHRYVWRFYNCLFENSHMQEGWNHFLQIRDTDETLAARQKIEHDAWRMNSIITLLNIKDTPGL